MASWISGLSLNDSAGFAASAPALDGIPSFATNFTEQSDPLASFSSASSCRRLFTLASTSISDRSSGECPSKKLRPSIPIGRTDSLNVRKRPFAGILASTCCQIFSGSIAVACSCTRGALVAAPKAFGAAVLGDAGDTPAATGTDSFCGTILPSRSSPSFSITSSSVACHRLWIALMIATSK